MSSFVVNLITVDSDSADRASRAKVLAGSAADALALVYGRDAYGTRLVGIFTDHLDGTGRAVAGAVAALFDSAVVHDAEPRGNVGCADFPLSLFLRSDLENGARGANLRAFDAFGTAVTSLEGHLGLHQVLDVFRRSKDIVGADRHAELAGCTVGIEVFYALGSERSDGD